MDPHQVNAKLSTDWFERLQQFDKDLESESKRPYYSIATIRAFDSARKWLRERFPELGEPGNPVSREL